MFRPMIDGKEKDWDVKLPQVMWALNTSPSNTTLLSPYLLIYGRLPTYPLAYFTSDRTTDVPTTCSMLIQGIIQTHDALKEHLEKQNAEHDQNEALLQSK